MYITYLAFFSLVFVVFEVIKKGIKDPIIFTLHNYAFPDLNNQVLKVVYQTHITTTEASVCH